MTVSLRRLELLASAATGVQAACAAWTTCELPSGRLLLLEQSRPSAPVLNRVVRSVAGPPSLDVRVEAVLPFSWWSVCPVDDTMLVFASAQDPLDAQAGELALVDRGEVVHRVPLDDREGWSPPVLASTGPEQVCVAWQSGGLTRLATYDIRGSRLAPRSNVAVAGLSGPLAALAVPQGLVIVGSGFGGVHTSAVVRRDGESIAVTPIPGIERGASSVSLRMIGDVVVASVGFHGDHLYFHASHYVLRRGAARWQQYRLGCSGRLNVGFVGDSYLVVFGDGAQGPVLVVDEVCTDGDELLRRVAEMNVEGDGGVVFSGTEAAHVALASHSLVAVRT